MAIPMYQSLEPGTLAREGTWVGGPSLQNGRYVAADFPGSTAGGPHAPASAAYLTHPQCTGVHHQAGQMPQSTFWASSESPPGKTTKVNGCWQESLVRGQFRDRMEMG